MPLRDDLLSRGREFEKHEIAIPEWRTTVYLRELTAKEREQFEEFILDEKGGQKGYIRAKLLVSTMITVEGDRIFSDADLEDVAQWPAHIVRELWEKARHISGLKGDAIEDAEKK